MKQALSGVRSQQQQCFYCGLKQTNKGICDMGSHFFGGIKRIDLVRVYIIHRYSQTVCLKAVLATDSGAVVCCASDSFFHQQVS